MAYLIFNIHLKVLLRLIPLQLKFISSNQEPIGDQKEKNTAADFIPTGVGMITAK